MADVLTGAVNPSARLPFTVPVDETDLVPFDADATSFTYDRWHGWWRAARRGIASAHAFGSGLSYTTFELGAVDISKAGGAIVVRGSVRNTGARDGSDVVQVYAELPDADAPDRLVGFTRVDVAAGGSAAFEVVVPVERLATRDAAAKAWRSATGRHAISVGRFAGDPASVRTDIDL